jgi:dTDP-4-dehydrorhamnose reductase
MILIIGAGGQVGTALAAQPGTLGITRRELDLAEATESDAAALIDAHQPDVVINAAAYTAVDRAETEEDLATRVNGEAVGMLARVCAARRIPFVTYSTDYVFDGNGTRPYLETDPVDPINAYGRSKLVGEQAVLEAGDTGLVIRTSWVISATHPNFVATMLRLTGEGRQLNVIDDQHGRPTIAADLATATLRAVEVGAAGILHLANHGETTWYELARTAVEMAGRDPGLIRPCATADYPTPAKRPAYSTLDTTRAEGLGVEPLPDWRQSLPAVVAGPFTVPG